jgi:hypothetical protein
MCCFNERSYESPWSSTKARIMECTQEKLLRGNISWEKIFIYMCLSDWFMLICDYGNLNPYQNQNDGTKKIVAIWYPIIQFFYKDGCST